MADGSNNHRDEDELERVSSATPQDDSNDNDLDPAAFLKSVRELSDRKEREDAERFRKLEEEVQKGREERAARRAERARSISPQKQQTSASNSTPATSRNLSRNAITTTASTSKSNPNVLSSHRVAFDPPTTTTTPAQSNISSTRNTIEMEPEKTSASAPADVPEFKGFGSMKRSSAASSKSSTQENPADANVTPTPSASNLARSGTLSWQQRPRPGSKLGGGRPLSMAAVEGSPSRTQVPSSEQPEQTRDEIAASLGARDPSWFRQTADRGVGNAAFRKSKEESSLGLSARRGLPGMSRESSVDAEGSGSPPTTASVKSDIVSRGGSVRESTLSDNTSRYSATSVSSNKPDLKSLIAADEDQQRASPSFDQASTASGDSSGLARAITMSSSQARLTNAADRPPSPTKGMGGFVQSAMMKRSDSHSKRWSAQPGTSLSRQNSVASSRGGLGGLQGSHSMPKFEPTPRSREASREPPPRPASSINTDLTSVNLSRNEQERDAFVKPALPHHSRSKSVASNYSVNEDSGTLQSPGSPSKRWSPSKSSWIESSLTRPESSKPAPSKNAQPSWMADLAKAKAQRASADVTSMVGALQVGEDTTAKQASRPGSPTKNTPFGPALLKRLESRTDSAPGDETAKSTTLGESKPESPIKDTPFGKDSLKRSETRELPKTPQSTTPTNKLKQMRLAEKFESSPSATENSVAPLPKPAGLTVSPDPAKVARQRDLAPAQTESEPDLKALTSITAPEQPPSEVSTLSETSSVRPGRSHTVKSSPATDALKSKPETPSKTPTDFRSQLRSRAPTESKPKDEPEFLSKFGNLRRTQQEKYVAPDVLKDNILRGKSGLAVTSGPVKTERKDELKESLLAKKDDWKKAKEEGRELPGQAHERKISETSKAPQAPSKPEALAKRELLGRADSARSVQQMERTREATPEALSRHKSLKQAPAPSSQADEASSTAPPEGRFASLSKQISAPGAMETKAPRETSRLAARFNPGLAGMLARGPPSNTPSRSESPSAAAQAVSSTQNTSTDPPAAGEPLQDMRKDRAKGPKRRRGAAKANVSAASDAGMSSSKLLDAGEQAEAPVPMLVKKQETLSPPSKPNPPTLSSPAASASQASLTKSPRPTSTGPYTQEIDTSSEAESRPTPKLKPQAPPGSMGSLMRASLNKSPLPDKGFNEEKSSTPIKTSVTTAGVVDLQKPSFPAKSPSLLAKGSPNLDKPMPPYPPANAAVPEFKGFGAARSQKAEQSSEENKENSGESLQSVRSAATQWSRRPSPEKHETSSQIQLPTKKDEEAAMRSASLLASGPAKPKNGLGIAMDRAGDTSSTMPPSSAVLPPKPAKSSRTVSGQLADASPNKGLTASSPTAATPKTESGRLLVKAFGEIPRYIAPLAIDTSTVLTTSNTDTSESIRTLRKTVQAVYPDGLCRSLPPQEEYTFFDESVFLCTHAYTNPKGFKSTQVFVWAGMSAIGATVDTATAIARKYARENGAATVHNVRQGQEPQTFFQAIGGIFITRRNSKESAPKQYMLCGRKHLGHVVFDEVNFAIDSLCPGFVYLISYPVTLQETKLYLWKGHACSAEELSAARLAAIDLSEAGEIIEVDSGVEFSSFLKIFGANTTKWNVPKASELWQQKASAPDRFRTRLFRIQQAEMKTGLLSSLWNRRPSWNSMSPARSPAREDDVKVEAKEISPFTQSELQAEGIYLLDAYSELYIIIGPLLSFQPDKLRDKLLGQTLLFASDYTIMSAAMEDRPSIPKCSTLLSGVPRDFKMMFRHWDDKRGLWGTASLMAGSTFSPGKEVKLVPLEDMLTEVCRD